MNLSDANQIQAFTESVMRPAFDKLKTLLDIPGQRVTITHTADTGKPAVNSLLHQMHPDTPYLDTRPSHYSLSEEPFISTQSWICGSLVVEILQHPESDAICVKYGLSIELKFAPLAQIQVASIIGFTKTEEEAPEVLHLLFKANHQPSGIKEIDRTDITLRFIEHFRPFEAQVLESKKVLEEISEPSNLIETTLFSETLPEPILEPSPPAPSSILTPLPEAPSSAPTLQPPSYEAAEAARAKIRAVQRQAIEPLLKYLKQSQKTFRAIWTSDLERGSALAQKTITDRPEPESDYQPAFDILTTQASEFAWSFKPNNLGEFADYFELYWTMAERASLFNASQANRPYPEAFIDQVHELGEPANPTQPSIIRPLRSLVRSISVKFGYPKEPGKLNWIGDSNIHSFTSTEEMIELIQSQNENRHILFETLSWGYCRSIRT